MFKKFVTGFKQADVVLRFIYANVVVYIIFVLIGVFSVLFN